MTYEGRINIQGSRAVFIERLSQDVKKPDTRNPDITTLQTNLEILETYWAKFEDFHEKLVGGKDPSILEYDYVTSKVYDTCLSQYAATRSTLVTLIRSKDENADPLSDSFRRLNQVSAQHSRTLPKITLPTFSGKYAAWRSFEDLFASMVANNRDISSVEKMHYLRTSLTGEAAQLISNLPVSEDSFASAWDLLTSRYDNERLLITAQLEKLLSPSIIQVRSAKELNNLLTAITEAQNALTALGCPVNQWDIILVHTVAQRLDSNTREAWENEIGSSTAFPSYADLKTFITGRARALECIEMHHPSSSAQPKNTSEASKPNSTRSAQQHVSITSSAASKSLVTNSAGSSQTIQNGPWADTSRYPCSMCNDDHFVVVCSQFRQLTPAGRKEVVVQKRLCYNCFERHNVQNCKNSKRCTCERKHHTMIHIHGEDPSTPSSPAQRRTSPSTSSAQADTNSAQQTNSTRASQQSTRVLLATSLAYLAVNHSTSHKVRLLIDPGSELSFVSEKLVKLLNLKKTHSAITITGIGESTPGHTRGTVQLTLRSIHSDQTLNLNAHILAKLTTCRPSILAGNVTWPHIDQLQLADPEFLTPGPIDLLIGADVYGCILEEAVVKAEPHAPVAQLAKFGWIVFGPTERSTPLETISHHAKINNDDLQDLLSKFWVQEEIPAAENSNLTPEEVECEKHFQQTHSSDISGRYIVQLPLCASPTLLGDSKKRAQACLDSLIRRIAKDPGHTPKYSEFLKEYENLGHMRRVQDPPHHSVHYYFPHHGVLKGGSETTKLRVVFNGSSKTSTGKSLNDIMYTVAKLQRDISDVLRARQHRLIFMTDIAKMFRQINVHKNDWPIQQILWSDSRGQTHTYQLTTITYGTRSAPFLAGRVLNQLVVDEGHKYPLAVSPLTKGRYVDDICGGADTQQELQKVAQQLQELYMADISQDQRTYEDSQAKILGLSWLPSTDKLLFSSKVPDNSAITKRAMLPEVAQLFDPLGFLSPVVIRAKILLQSLWIERVGWDDSLSPRTQHKWSQFREELTHLEELTIPRWLGLNKDSLVEIHGFSDASNLAMAAVVHLKITSCDRTTISLVCAKSKVAPIKHLSIPRLELTAAVLLAELIQYILSQLSLNNAPIFLWTDSAVTYTWINSHPSRWKEFVRNRVSKIQDTVPQAHWRLVPGKENPADCASRGVSVRQLKNHHLWWAGSSWLKSDSSAWPSPSKALDPSEDLEEKPGVLLSVQIQRRVLWDLIDRYSTLTKLLRITAICQRFISRLERVPNSSLITPLNPWDLELARLFWVKLTQAAHFRHELKLISKNERFARSHPMVKLIATIDHQGILRVQGRLKFAHLDLDRKHPAISPKESQLAQLIIGDAHQKTLHGGTQLTSTHIRRSYWILGGRAPVRSYILKCVPCARQRGVRAQQLMGQLPAARLTPSKAFLTTGVDYAGPVSIRAWKGRGHKTHKGWLAIFVCMVTSAVHLEVVSDYSTDGFIAAYRRFTSRRGICKSLFSDCGTNFVGADKELKNLFLSGSKDAQHLAHLLLNDGTQWSFNPPGAPHFGGKWKAAVKSVKHHLTRTIGDSTLTFEELTTLLTQIEAVLNSRPLVPLTDDPDDLAALTPGHFLIGKAPITVPEPWLDHLNVNRLSRWQFIQQKLQTFWIRWSTRYLQSKQAISKWYHPTHDIKVGSMVLLTDERFPPSKWPLARVTALHTGPDGLTRVVTIRTAVSTLDRPITKLTLLPVSPPDPNSQ